MALSRNQKKGALAVAGGTLLALLTIDEGTRYVPYRDVVGVLTVCQGHTGPDIILGKRYTKAECDALLVKNVAEHGRGVLACTKVPLNQNQYDAFVRFTYNVGVSAYCHSTLVKKLNAGDYTGACWALDKWVYAGGRKIQGLVNRRASERNQCLTPMPKTSSERGVA